MATRATLLVIVGLVAAAAAGAVYAPGQAERLVPGAGERALQARAALPAAIVERLPPARPFETKAASSARSAESAKADAPKAQPVATAPPRPPANVVVGTAARKRMEVRLDAIGSVQPIASVALRTRIDAQIDRIFVADGAAVKAGDMLIKLDSRQIEAQIKQSEAALAKDRATLDQVNRDVGRYSQLVANQAGTQIALDNAKTAVLGAQAAVMGDSAALDNLKVQLGWYSIMAPISGRVGAFTLKAGNVVRSGDNGATGTLAVINQITPIYVAFSISQRYLADLRQAMLATGAVSGRDAAGADGGRVGQGGGARQRDRRRDGHDHRPLRVRQPGRGALAGPVVQRAHRAAQRGRRRRPARGGCRSARTEISCSSSKTASRARSRSRWRVSRTARA